MLFTVCGRIIICDIETVQTISANDLEVESRIRTDYSLRGSILLDLAAGWN